MSFSHLVLLFFILGKKAIIRIGPWGLFYCFQSCKIAAIVSHNYFFFCKYSLNELIYTPMTLL